MKLTVYKSEWGIPLFDKKYSGLPQNSLNILKTLDEKSGFLSIFRFLLKGIQLDEKVVLIAFEDPEDILSRIRSSGLDCDQILESERLYILSYKDTFTRSLNMTENYRLIFDEIKKLTSEDVSRIAFLNADLLFNLETYNLAVISASKLYRAAKLSNSTILAQYTCNSGRSHRLLEEASHSLVDCYITMARSKENKLKLNVRSNYLQDAA